ncbi:serine/threonine-protein kinase [Streptomyces sp. NPDC088554]|uniref:serine/threonine-protein kinase n=1 Tax=Streptomyces sp. NPDC088554 TaxID=3365865 RepID=UPI00382EC902
MEKLAAGDPQRIGAYRLLARLGTGGMGRVYLARSDRGRTVAVKLVRRELAEEEQFRSRFRQEVAAARRVGGAWTAPVLDADTEAPVPWLATGYVAGPSLRTVVSGGRGGRGHGPLPERSVQFLASGLAHALQDIHAAGLIHRDLKPSNVLVTIDGPRVIDFGIARALETAADEGLTRTGALVGSPGFMAPEQVRGDRVTAACDVFCLGSVLAYAATGKLPFGGANTGVHALMFRIAQEEPDLSGLPASLYPLISGCLRKDPAARPTTRDILLKVAGSTGASAGAGLSDEPWLPGALLAQLGKHAVELLEYEEPTARIRAPEAGPAPVAGPAPEPAPIPEPAPSPVPRSAPPRTPPPPLPYRYGHPPARHGGPPPPEPARRDGRGTAALIVVAVIVAICTGASVYAVMGGGPKGGKDGGTAPTTEARSPGPRDDDAAAGTPSAAPTASEGAIPATYLGAWSGGIDTASGHNTRELTIRQGTLGDTVLTLTADGPAGSGSYHCVFEAPLAATPAPGAPLRIGPSTVVTGDPLSSCAPGPETTLTLQADGTLRRVASGGESLTYTKTG